MIGPSSDEVLAAVVQALEELEAADEATASTLRTATQLLRSVRVRLREEPAALAADNADLAAVLEVPLPAGDLREAAVQLRAELVSRVDADPTTRDAAAAWARRSLARQRPWLVDAFTGPRR